MSDWLDEDRFTISQLIKPMVNLYTIKAGPAPVAFVRQKRMAIKEDIRFFADESEAHELWRIKARSVMEFGGRYDVVTPEGGRIGVLGKVFGKSLFRSTSFRVGHRRERAAAGDCGGAVCLGRVPRRVIEVVPYGDFVPIPFHFTIDDGDTHIGDLNRRFGNATRTTSTSAATRQRENDRRLAVALAVALDALQSR